MRCGLGAGCGDSRKEAMGLVQGQVEQLLQVERGSGGVWLSEEVGRGEIAPCHCDWGGPTVFSAGLTPLQKHCTPLSPSQAPCRFWATEGWPQVLGLLPGQGREGLCKAKALSCAND